MWIDAWRAKDGELVYLDTPILDKLSKFTTKLLSFDFYFSEFKHEMGGYCTWADCVRRNTDNTLDWNDKGWPDDSTMCQKCRGKGHPWTAEIWNGHPTVCISDLRNQKYLICDGCSGNGYLLSE